MVLHLVLVLCILRFSLCLKVLFLLDFTRRTNTRPLRQEHAAPSTLQIDPLRNEKYFLGVDDTRDVPCLVFKCAGFVITRAGTEAIPNDM